MDENAEPEESYKDYIRQRWFHINELEMEFRAGLMTKDNDGKVLGCDVDTARQYIAELTNLWTELCPKVKGRQEFKQAWRDDADGKKFKDLQHDFLEFRPYAANPSLFFNQTEEGFDGNKLFLLHEILREVIEKLKITWF